MTVLRFKPSLVFVRNAAALCLGLHLASCAPASREIVVTVSPTKTEYTYPALVQYDIRIVNRSKRAITVMEQQHLIGEAPVETAPDRHLRSIGEGARTGAAVPRTIPPGDSISLQRDVDKASAESVCTASPLLPPGEYFTTVQVPVHLPEARRDVTYSAECAFRVLENNDLPDAFAAFLRQVCICREKRLRKENRTIEYAALELLAEDVLAVTTSPDVVLVLADNLLANRPEWKAGRVDAKLFEVFLAAGGTMHRRYLFALFDLFPRDTQLELFEHAARANTDATVLASLKRRFSGLR
ncbi:MAG: hypothetical protein IPP94_05215 [Ignavibacteria bacterium]|nr:hypothetical protein [Ignavibacteria bacterium]